MWKEYPVEQLVRDCKNTSIYEGTDGIQAMDLLWRKLGMAKGRVFMNLLGEIQKTIALGLNLKRIKAAGISEINTNFNSQLTGLLRTLTEAGVKRESL